jgi:energy-coupling factor transport system permease protein
MSIFFYSRQDTFFHAIDPRVKLGSLVFLFIASAFCSSVTVLAMLAASFLAMFYASKSMGSLNRMWPVFLITGASTFLLWIFFYEGSEIIFSMGPVHIYKGAVDSASVYTLRFLDMLLAGLLYLSIASIEDLSDALILNKVPYKVAFTISLSFRLVLIFVSTGFTILEAQKVRGNNTEKGGVLKRISSYAPLMIPLIINGIKKAETLTLALESKGFSPDNRMDLREKHVLKPSDIAVMFLLAAVTAAAIALGKDI